MPKFRFETTTSGQTTAFEEELDSPEMASPRAIEKARAAIVADPWVWHRAIGLNYQGLR